MNTNKHLKNCSNKNTANKSTKIQTKTLANGLKCRKINRLSYENKNKN